MIRGFKLFGDNNYKNGGLIAAYHNPKSLTWRWIISYQWRFKGWGKHPSKWVMLGKMIHNFGGDANVCIGPISFRFSWQEPTWRKPPKPEISPKVPSPFPYDFDVEDGVCLVCGGALDTRWECNDCGADHYHGVMLIQGGSVGQHRS